MPTLTPERQKPSLFRVIIIDRWAFVLALIPIVFWGLIGLAQIFGVVPDLRWGRDPMTAEDALLLMPIAAGITIITIPLCVWRVRVVWNLLTKGMLVAGSVTNLVFFRDRGRVDYHYTYEGQEWKAQAGVMKVKRTQALATRKDITIVVDPKKPGRTLIWELFV
jgi:hypothetical protein